MAHTLTANPTKMAARLAGAALLMSLTACGGGPNQPHYDHASGNRASGGNSAVEIALAGRGDLSVFAQALHNTGVANELNENTEYTVFAPTNAAFAEIQPRYYPCFYAAQCRPQIAALLRNHIVPKNDNLVRLARWGGDIHTLGNRRLNVEEPFKDSYTVENRHILFQNRGARVNLLTIDGVIASHQDLAVFQVQPTASAPSAEIEKTVTTYRTPAPYYYPVAPGGTLMMINPETTTETTTITHTTNMP